MKKQRSLIGIIQLSMWLLSSLLVIILGFLWVNAEFSHSKLHAETIQKTFLARQKNALKTDIDSVIAQISYKRSQLETKVKAETQARTEEAYQTALYLYEQNKAHKSLSEIAKLIHDALYAVSWDNERGYYFAEDMQGTELINRNNPELEGRNISDLQDSNGKYIMQEILAVAHSKKREGFCTYFWNRPGNSGVLVPKISYVKFFAPLNWVIGNGIYLDDAEKQIKQEILAQINALRLDGDKYIFAGTFNGVSLSGPAKGRNMWEAADPNGTKIVQELIKQAKKGGGFVEYVMPKLQGQRPSPKLSYATQIPDWQWYIGTGVYVDYIEDAIAHEQEISRKEIQKIVTKIILVLCLFLFISLLFSWFLTGKIKNNLALFLEFFQKSANEKLSIPPDKVSFREFQSLALSANQMVEDRQQAWEDLSAEQERLAVTLQSIGDGVMTTDTKGNILLLNKVAEKLTGWSNAEAQGKPSTDIFNIFDARSGEKCLSPIQRVLKSGKSIELANYTALLAKDGSQKSIADSGAPIRDSEGKILGVVMVFRDVTNEKKIEEELLKIKKLESVGVLAGGIAHDFNNILAAILGNVELASHRLGPQHKVSPLLNEAKNASNRATKLTQQLLTFAKGGNPVKETTSVPQIIRESADFSLHGSQVSCHYDYPENLWCVDVDSGQIGQVIQNIVLNAKHAMPEGGQIKITCSNIENAVNESLPSSLVGSYVKISIADSGVGMPAKVLEKIFDPYFTTKQDGSGLGLAICHSIISKHNGHIRAKSISGEGTTFNLYLPAILSADPRKNDDEPNSITPTINPLKIMVMDDDEMLRNIVEAQLSYLGHEIILVTNGAEAINNYQEQQELGSPVDLIIMDLTIPGGMGGKEAVQEILKLNPDAKVIVTSGYSNDPVMANYKEYGFVAAAIKPFDLKTINNIITSLF